MVFNVAALLEVVGWALDVCQVLACNPEILERNEVIELLCCVPYRLMTTALTSVLASVSDATVNIGISVDIYYEVSLLNGSSNYRRLRPRLCRYMVDQGGVMFLERERMMYFLEVDSLVPSPSHGCSWDNCQVYNYPKLSVYIVVQLYVTKTLLEKPSLTLTEVKNFDYLFSFVIIFTGAQGKEVPGNLTLSSSQLESCVLQKSAFSSVTSSGRETHSTVELEDFGSSTPKLTCDVQLSNEWLKKHKPCLSTLSGHSS